ncbi:MAG: hypothetical protein ACKOBI_10825, partial [Bacteroidota bacterium]
NQPIRTWGWKWFSETTKPRLWVSPALQPWYHLTPQTHVANSSQDESITDADDVHFLSIHSGGPSRDWVWWSPKSISIPRAVLADWGCLLTSALPTRAP